MRAAIAKNTSLSAFTAPHVTTMWDLDMSAVVAHRAAHKKEFAADGVNLTLTAYFMEAILAGLRKVPAANATWSDDGVILKRYYNIGMATALPMDANGLGGLIVPVIKNAGDLTLMGLARAVNELAEKARKNQLRTEDLAAVADYPDLTLPGQNQSMYVGIGNHEYQDVTYTIETWMLRTEFDNVTNTSRIKVMDPNPRVSLTLAHNETTIIPYNLSFNRSGYNRVEFLLFGENVPGFEVNGSDRINASYRDLHLKVINY